MAKGRRKAAKITIAALNNIILTKAGEDVNLKDLINTEDVHFNIYELLDNCSKLHKDISKIVFDFENYEMSQRNGYCDLCGYHTLDNGLTFLGIGAGGDWESSVFFIIYWDGKGLRGYIPEDGNIYNKITKTAFGSEGESEVELDPVKHKKKILKMFSHKTEEDYNNAVKEYEKDKTQWPGEEFCQYVSGWGNDLDFDCQKLENDIKNRIEVVE